MASAPRAWGALSPPLSSFVLDALASMGFAKPTPVQASTISLFMCTKDVVVEAVTGSGKTLAFLIPVIEKLLRLDEPVKKHHIGAIIVSPTRELATQIFSVLCSLLTFHPPSAAALREVDGSFDTEDAVPAFPQSSLRVVPQLLLGGTSTPAQDISRFLKNSPNLLVATPGRLVELLSSPHVHCPQSSFEVLVMDEADRLLDLGFKDDIQKILQRLPKQRRTGLFSASVSEAVSELVRVGLRNPVRIAVRVKSTTGASDRRTPASLSLTYLVTAPTEKIPALSKLLACIHPRPQKSIVYFATCYSVDYFSQVLPRLLPDYAIIPLHGKYQPNVRRKNFTRFVESLAPTLLLTTDVAARGLDIPSVDLVVQMDPPSDPKVFIHRCGRAGRAGRKGVAVTFLVPGHEEDYVEFLNVRKTPISPFTQHTISVRPEDAESTTATIRRLVLQDRALHDRAQRAFVSWVQAYSKHEAKSIFRVSSLDWDGLAQAWGLLRLPRMPELKKWEGDSGLGLNVDFDNYRYKDKQQEKRRKEEMEKRKLEKRDGSTAKPTHQKNAAWSGQKELKETRRTRREKKQARRERDRSEKMTEEEKDKARELEAMIAEVKKQNIEEEDEFMGFD